MFDRFVAFRARQSPHSVAVTMPTGEVSFAQFDLSIGRMAAALAQEPRPALAAVRIADPYLQWLVVLALARLSIASALIAPGTERALLPVVQADLVISDAPETGDGLPDPARRLHVTQAWAAAALARTDAMAAPLRRTVDAGATGQVTTSSGSTGTPKAVVLSWAAIDARMRNWMDWGAERSALARVMPLLGGGARSQTLAAWASGGRLLAATPTPAGIAQALSRLRPTWIIAAPNQLQAVLDALPAGFMPLSDLHVMLLGSHAPLGLRREARLRLTPNLTIAYGTSETGLVALGSAASLGDDEAACGWLVPGAEAEAVDEAGRPLAPGGTGLLRFRGADVVGAYRDGAGADGAFRDGWYHTGDVGTLSALGALRVEGRADDRMNFGGIKMLPRLIEEVALSCPGVRDAAAFAVRGPDGLDRPWLALVREGRDGAALGAALRERLPGLPPVRVADVAAVPRNAGGKIERQRLRDAVAANDRG